MVIPWLHVTWSTLGTVVASRQLSYASVVRCQWRRWHREYWVTSAHGIGCDFPFSSSTAVTLRHLPYGASDTDRTFLPCAPSVALSGWKMPMAEGGIVAAYSVWKS